MSIGDGLRTEVVWILNDKCLESSIIVPSEHAGSGNCENRKRSQEEIGKGGRIVVLLGSMIGICGHQKESFEGFRRFVG